MPEQFVPLPCSRSLRLGWPPSVPGPLEAFPWDVQRYNLMLRKIISRARDGLDFLIRPRFGQHEYIKGANGAFFHAISIVYQPLPDPLPA
jgi:hypothetical protein